ncbi:MAG: VWA domain-containing protein [Chloroflexota bacterium]|nr:VWA domain-containing protein [Chloroflexota bacterium]
MEPTSLPAQQPVRISARWERPVVAATGGAGTLLVRIATPARPETHRRAPVDVAFVLDRSGSMAGEKLSLAKRAVDVAAGFLHDEDRAALVTFDHTVEVVHPAQRATPRGKTALRLALPGIDAGGSTDLGSGWLTGCREISDGAAPVTDGTTTESRVRRALVLTDGLANVGITDPAHLTRHAHELRQRGIGTTTLGIGLDFDEALLSGLAEAGGGNFQFIARPDQLRAFFEHELHELLNVSAIGMTLTMTSPTGVRFDLVNAFPARRDGKQLTIALGDLPAAEELDLIFEVRTAGGTIGGVRHLTIAASWSNPATDSHHQTTLETPALTFATPAMVVAAAADEMVTEIAALLRATVERRAALALDRAGDRHASRQRMHQAAAMLASAPMTERVRDDLTITARYAAAPETTAYSDADRKQGEWQNALRRRGRREPTSGR